MGANRAAAIGGSSERYREELARVLKFGGPGARVFFDDRFGFAGRSLDLLGRETERTSSKDGRWPTPTSLDISDLFAVTLLDLRWPPTVVRSLTRDGPAKEALETWLRDKTQDVRLWELTGNDRHVKGRLSPSYDFWSKLVKRAARLPGMKGIGTTHASKLMARLRPELIPVRDSVIERVFPLGRDDDDWELLNAALCDGFGSDHSTLLPLATELRNGLLDLLEDPEYPLLRVLDAAAWMLGSGSRSVTGLRHVRDGAAMAFVAARESFWRERGEDPWPP